MPKEAILSTNSQLIFESNTKYHFEESFSSLGKPRDQKRTFTKYQKNEILYQQEGKCASTLCHHKKLDPKKIQFEHKKPWTSDGRAVMQYGRVICLDCQCIASNKKRVKRKSKQKKSMLFF